MSKLTYLACQDVLALGHTFLTVQNKDSIAEPSGKTVQAVEAGMEVGRRGIKDCQGWVAGWGMILCACTHVDMVCVCWMTRKHLPEEEEVHLSTILYLQQVDSTVHNYWCRLCRWVVIVLFKSFPPNNPVTIQGQL